MGTATQSVWRTEEPNLFPPRRTAAKTYSGVPVRKTWILLALAVVVVLGLGVLLLVQPRRQSIPYGEGECVEEPGGLTRCVIP